MGYLKIDEYGNKFWYNDKGELHRVGRPAVLTANFKLWYINGVWHRDNGPAVEFTEVGGTKMWYYNGERIGDSRYGFTQKDFKRYLRLLKIKEYW